MLDPVLIALLVQALKYLAELYLPSLPITVELINAIILLLLGWQLRNGVVAVIARVRPAARAYFYRNE